MGAAMLETRDLTIRFGGHVAVDHVSCQFKAGELTAIVGPNGAGKTTYFNLISGQLPASEGQILLQGRNITHEAPSARTHLGIGRAFQLTQLFPDLSVLENIRLVIQSKAKVGFNFFSMADSLTELTSRALDILKRINLAHAAGQKAAELSHGEQRKLEVALMIALDPLVLMFDEPTAGMSVDEVPMILDFIGELKADTSRCILLVEHKMDVIHTLADRIIVLHNGALVADGSPSEVMASEIVKEAYLGKDLADV